MPISVSGAGRASGLASVDGPGPAPAPGSAPAPDSAGGADFGPGLTLPGRVEPAAGDLPRGWVGFLVRAAPFPAGGSASPPASGAGLAPGVGVSSSGAGLVAGGGVCVAVPAGTFPARAGGPAGAAADSPGRSTSSALTGPAPCSGVRRSWLQSWWPSLPRPYPAL